MGVKFLVINRIGTLRRQTIRILMDLGYSDIRQANGFEEAMREIISVKLSELIIILELTTSGLTTEEEMFLKQFNRSDILKNIPVIVTCQNADKTLIFRLSRFHVKTFILKSGSDESFSRRIKKAVKTHKLLCFPAPENQKMHKEAMIG